MWNSSDAKERKKKKNNFFLCFCDEKLWKEIFLMLWAFSIKHRKLSPGCWPFRKALMITSPSCTIVIIWAKKSGAFPSKCKKCGGLLASIIIIGFFLVFFFLYRGNSNQIDTSQATKPIAAWDLWPWTTAVKWESQRKVLTVAGRVEGPGLREQLSGGLALARYWGQVGWLQWLELGGYVERLGDLWGWGNRGRCRRPAPKLQKYVGIGLPVCCRWISPSAWEQESREELEKNKWVVETRGSGSYYLC